jgi:hypothetical protein
MLKLRRRGATVPTDRFLQFAMLARLDGPGFGRFKGACSIARWLAESEASRLTRQTRHA